MPFALVQHHIVEFLDLGQQGEGEKQKRVSPKQKA